MGPEELEAARSATRVVGDTFALTNVERDCVASKVAGDPALSIWVGAVGRVAGLADEDRRVVERAARVCVHEHSSTEAFVESFRFDHPEVSDEQLVCLASGYRAISPEDLQTVIDAANNPMQGDDGRAIMDRLLSDCGVQP